MRALICLLSLLPLLLSGKVLERQALHSEIMGQTMHYTVYLPPDYDASKRSYPVVYLLHGYSDDDTGWIQFGHADHIADQAITAGDIAPMILIMPDARVTFYINNHDGATNFEDYFLQELMPHVEKRFRIRREKQYRGLVGLSMGGYGATILGLRNAERFCGFVALSAAVQTPAEYTEQPAARYQRVYSQTFGPQPTTGSPYSQHFLNHNIHHLAQTMDAETLKSLRMRFDCGDDDFLLAGNLSLHQTLKARGIPHQLRIRDGAHTWSYWRQTLPDALAFLSETFHR